MSAAYARKGFSRELKVLNPIEPYVAVNSTLIRVSKASAVEAGWPSVCSLVAESIINLLVSEVSAVEDEDIISSFSNHHTFSSALLPPYFINLGLVVLFL